MCIENFFTEKSFFLSICVKTNCISTKTYLGKKTEEIGINLKQDKRRRGNQQLSIDHTEDTHLKNSISSVVPKKSY